jgi:microfibrillar-associated protein 1
VRYRAGQVPHFAAGYEEERGFVTASSQVRGVKGDRGNDGAKAALGTSRRRIEAKVMLSKAPAPERGARGRIADSDDDASSSGGEDAAKALQDSSSDEDEEEFNRRRQMLRSKMQEREAHGEDSARGGASPSPSPPRESESERRPVAAQIVRKSEAKPAVKPAAAQQSSSSSDSSGSSEWETDSDDSDAGEQLMKPVFVPKKARETLKRQEELEAEEERRRQRELEKVRLADSCLCVGRPRSNFFMLVAAKRAQDGGAPFGRRGGAAGAGGSGEGRGD